MNLIEPMNFKTYFNLEIFLPGGGTNISGFDTLQGAKMAIVRQGHYLITDGGYAVEDLDYLLTEECYECYGDGRVQKDFAREADRRRHRYDPVYVRCPACKGKNSRRVVIPKNQA